MRNQTQTVGIALMTLGALVFMLPGVGDPYSIPRFIPVMIGALIILFSGSVRVSTLAPALGIYAFAVFLSATFTADVGYTLIGPRLAPADSIMAIAAYGAVIGAAATIGDVKRLSWWVMAATLPLSIYACFQTSADPLLPAQLPAGGRVIASQGSPVYLGACLALGALCTLSHITAEKKRTEPWACWSTLGFALIGMWKTQTRGALLAFVIGSMFLLRGRWKLSALLGLPILFLHPRLYSAIADTARIEIWKTALNVFKDAPFLGYGPGTFEIAFRRFMTPGFVKAMGSSTVAQSHAHNEPLHVLATMGLVGLTAYAFLLVSVLGLCVQKDPDKRKLLLSLFVAYLVFGQFNPVPHSAFFVLALIFGAASAKQEWMRPKIKWAPVVLGAVALALSFRVTQAERHFYLAGMASGKDIVTMAQEFSRAAEKNPWEIRFTGTQVDSLIALMNYTKPEDRPKVAGIALRISEKAAQMHPLDPSAHEIVGRARLLAHAVGIDESPQHALADLRRGQELAWSFRPLMHRRRAVAAALGNDSELSLCLKAIAKIDKLTQGAL